MTIYIVVIKSTSQELAVHNPIIAAYSFKSMAEIRAIEEDRRLSRMDVIKNFRAEVEPVELVE